MGHLLLPPQVKELRVKQRFKTRLSGRICAVLSSVLAIVPKPALEMELLLCKKNTVKNTFKMPWKFTSPLSLIPDL